MRLEIWLKSTGRSPSSLIGLVGVLTGNPKDEPPSRPGGRTGHRTHQ